MFDRTRALPSAILGNPRSGSFPFIFRKEQRMENSTIRRKPVATAIVFGVIPCILGLGVGQYLRWQGNGLADERRCVLADCLLCDFGCCSGLVSNFFVKRQNCTHLGMANTHVDVAVFPALANCARDTAIVGGRIQGWTCLRRQRMGSTAFGQGVAPHGSRRRQDRSQRSRDGYRQCRRAAVSLFRALHF